MKKLKLSLITEAKMKNVESFFEFKKYDVFMQSWLTETPSDHHLLIVHGLGEHSSSYAPMAQYLCEKEISCHSFDFIGHGQSAGQRGYVPSFDLFAEQLVFVFNHLKNKYKTANVTIFCHSMGGLVTLKALLLKAFPAKTPLILSNPLVGINVDIPQWKLTLADGLAQFLPRLALGNEIKNADLTKDPEMLEKYSQDPLRHKKISSRLFIELKENTALVSAQLKAVENPALFLLSPNDRVCDADASQKMVKNFKTARMELFPQSGHEIVNDLSKERAFDDIVDFMKNG